VSVWHTRHACLLDLVRDVAVLCIVGAEAGVYVRDIGSRTLDGLLEGLGECNLRREGILKR
jgi:hypothetical protein